MTPTMVNTRRVRIPTDANLAAAARRAAMLPDNMLLRRLQFSDPTYVEILPGGSPGAPHFRAYFLQPSGKVVCYIRPRMWAVGVRLPTIGDIITLQPYTDYVDGQLSRPATYVIDGIKVALSFRTAELSLAAMR